MIHTGRRTDELSTLLGSLELLVALLELRTRDLPPLLLRRRSRGGAVRTRRVARLLRLRLLVGRCRPSTARITTAAATAAAARAAAAAPAAHLSLPHALSLLGLAQRKLVLVAVGVRHPPLDTAILVTHGVEHMGGLALPGAPALGWPVGAPARRGRRGGPWRGPHRRLNVVVLVLLHHRLPRAHELVGRSLDRGHLVLAQLVDVDADLRLLQPDKCHVCLAKPLERLRDRLLRLLRPLLARTVPALELLVRRPRCLVGLDRILQLAVRGCEIAHRWANFVANLAKGGTVCTSVARDANGSFRLSFGLASNIRRRPAGVLSPKSALLP
eukprot:scaffold122597_cov63-Phaeocystis_antarctica.AAC.3